MTQKFSYFGTDGIRGKVGVPPITNDFVLKLGWATGKMLATHNSTNRPTVLIGKDTRISGYMLESALQAGLVSSGCDIKLCGPLATPGIAYLTRTFRADIGIVISASHNPYSDNGIKLFASNGIKIDDGAQQQIETNLKKNMECVPAIKLGKVSRINDAVGRYVEYCKSVFPNTLSLKGLRIVVDCANGAAYNTAPMVFNELGAETFIIGDDPDGFNINSECGSTAPGQASELVRKYRANLGIVLDGDGDRVMMIDEAGTLLDGDDLLYILIWSMHERGVLKGVVGTYMTNMAIEEFCKENGLGFSRVDVGDRNIIRQLAEFGWNLGAEPSGHVICSDYATTGDGIVTSLLVLAVLQIHGIDLRRACRNFRRYGQVLRSVRYLPSQKQQAMELVAGYNQQLEQQEQQETQDSRTLLRLSGTEPVIRIMIEARDQELASRICDETEQQILGLLDKTATKAN